MEVLPWDRRNAAQGGGAQKTEPPALILPSRASLPVLADSVLCVFNEIWPEFQADLLLGTGYGNELS